MSMNVIELSWLLCLLRNFLRMMNKKCILSIAALCVAGLTFGQTLSQARKWFDNGDFEKAKPVFYKLVRQAPSNVGYNFWYGACCYETGELSESFRYLKKSADRRYVNAYLYLGRYYYATYHFDDAIKNMEEYIHWLEVKKKETDEAQQELARYRKAARMIRAVEKVMVIDSVVVDKAIFLSAYHLSKSVGSISANEEGRYVQFVNEMGDKKMYASPASEAKTEFYSQFRMIDEWGEPERVKGIEGNNPDYPFLAADGVTLYYGTETEDGLGGCDIVVTRYDSDSNSYLRSSNLGMPFNSPYNDYMYVLDDYAGLGWFASDRYQPEGKVCIYTFVPSQSKETYEYETEDVEKITAAAALSNIAVTWFDKEKVDEARQRLAEQQNGEETAKKKKGFSFIVNDHTVYSKLSDFKSKDACTRYQQLLQKRQDFSELQQSLEDLRIQYMQLDGKARKAMSPGMLDMEKRIEDLRAEIETLEVKTRNEEIQSWKK